MTLSFTLVVASPCHPPTQPRGGQGHGAAFSRCARHGVAHVQHEPRMAGLCAPCEPHVRSSSYASQLSREFNIILTGNRRPSDWQIAAVPNRPACRERKIIIEQMNEAALETAADVGGENVMHPLFHALPHAGNGLHGAGTPEVMQFDLVTELPCGAKQSDLAAQGCFERESLTSAQARPDLSQQQVSGQNCPGAGLERGKTARNFIRVQKAQALHFFGQKLLRECGLSRAVAPGNDENRRPFGRHMATRRTPA